MKDASTVYCIEDIAAVLADAYHPEEATQVTVHLDLYLCQKWHAR